MILVLIVRAQMEIFKLHILTSLLQWIIILRAQNLKFPVTQLNITMVSRYGDL